MVSFILISALAALTSATPIKRELTARDAVDFVSGSYHFPVPVNDLHPRCSSLNFDAKCRNGKYPCANGVISDVYSLGNNAYQVTFTFDADHCGSLNDLGELKIIGINSPESSTDILFSRNSGIYRINDACHWSATFVINGEDDDGHICTPQFQVQYDWLHDTSEACKGSYDYLLSCNGDNQGNAQADFPQYCWDPCNPKTTSTKSTSTSTTSTSTTSSKTVPTTTTSTTSTSTTSSKTSSTTTSTSTTSTSTTSSKTVPTTTKSTTSTSTTSSKTSPTTTSKTSTSTTPSHTSTSTTSKSCDVTPEPSCSSLNFNFKCSGNYPCATGGVTDVVPLGNDEYEVTFKFDANDCASLSNLGEVKIIGLNGPEGQDVIFSRNSHIYDITDACHWTAKFIIKGVESGSYVCTPEFQIQYDWFSGAGVSTDEEASWKYQGSYDYLISCNGDNQGNAQADFPQYCWPTHNNVCSTTTPVTPSSSSVPTKPVPSSSVPSSSSVPTKPVPSSSVPSSSSVPTKPVPTKPVPSSSVPSSSSVPTKPVPSSSVPSSSSVPTKPVPSESTHTFYTTITTPCTTLVTTTTCTINSCATFSTVISSSKAVTIQTTSVETLTTKSSEIVSTPTVSSSENELSSTSAVKPQAGESSSSILYSSSAIESISVPLSVSTFVGAANRFDPMNSVFALVFIGFTELFI